MRRWWSVGARITAGLLTVGALGIGALSVGHVAQAQNGDVTELAKRVIGGPGGGDTVTLLPGELATDMPLSLPTPPGANVVGTVVRNPGNGIESWDVVMDVPAVPSDAGGFYDQTMPGMGWNPAPAAGDQPAPQGVFCQSANGPWMAVVAFPVSDSASDVRVRVESGDPGLCSGPPPTPQPGQPPAPQP